MTKSLFNKVTWTYHEIPTCFVSFLLWSSPSSFLLSQWGFQVYVSTFLHVPTLVICKWGFSIAMDICCFIFFWKFYYLILLCLFLSLLCSLFWVISFSIRVCLVILDLLVNLRMSKWITWIHSRSIQDTERRKDPLFATFLIHSLTPLFTPILTSCRECSN